MQKFHKIFSGVIAITAVLAILAADALAHGDEDHTQDNKKTPVLTRVDGATDTTNVSINLATPQRLPDGSLFIPKSLQRQLGLRTQIALTSDLAATVELNGKVISDPDTGGRVQANFAGSVLPGDKGMPVLGRKVIKGEILAYLRPVGSAIERGNQQAQQTELDAQLSIASRRLTRFEQLEGAVPQKEIESARIERDALKKRRNFVSASINANEPLVAPATGVISTSNVVAGQVVDAKELLFEIVDTTRLAVEALAYDMSIPATLTSANALTDQTALALKFIGSGGQLREQALPLLFRIIPNNSIATNAAPGIQVAVGQPLKVIVSINKGIKGISVARSALTKIGAGETAVWIHTEAERFVARRVRQQSLDANNIAITDGLHAGDRVVILGAGLLSEVR
ncbi:MAG: HlyD family efflux transporter periplasmic adaptor subunit [Burkholderiaceae bacterium]|nr:HlyD family efflux transporter periplasmic adaptor subunit [Burkholderiaceae bacterium]